MPYPKLTEEHNAWYHVMNQAAHGKMIFESDKLKGYLLKLLSEVVNTYNIEIHAYCIMSNHYHLLIRTPKANLATAMQTVSRNITLAYNKQHQSCGPIFRRRYKYKKVQTDTYLLTLVKYIHMNPVEANIVNKAEQYKWSSHVDYLEERKQVKWLTKKFVMLYCETVDGYKSFMSEWGG